MNEYPKALYRDGDVHGGDYVIVSDAEAEACADGYRDPTKAADEIVEKRKPGRPKKTTDLTP